MKNPMPYEPIDWKYSFRMEDGRVLITDRGIIIDQRYVQVDPLPADGTPAAYPIVKEYWALPHVQEVGYNDFTRLNSSIIRFLSSFVINKELLLPIVGV